jgi:transcriptional regulatory protein RtcR
MQDELLVDRLELLCERRFLGLGEQLVEDVRQVSPHTEVTLHPTDIRDAWDFEQVWQALAGWAKQQRWDEEAEDYLLHITTGSHVQQICLFLLAESRRIPARLLQTALIPKKERYDGDRNAGRYAIIDLDLSRYDSIARRFSDERSEALDFLKDGIATRNARFNRLMEQIEAVALASTAPMLLTGPTGAGKTRLAKRIYELKQQRRIVRGRYVEVNCATLRGDAAMSTLFGHKKGAFTGATADRRGLLSAADGGLIFLDEIGELGLDEQAMLLRAIEEGVFLPMGSHRESSSDFQLIAGTNRDLVDEVAAGRFRADLLARINLWTFRLPGLAERIEDLEPNLAYELESASSNRRVSFNAEARRAYLAFATGADGVWAGNFRDLNASVTRMATLAPGGRIDRRTVDEEIGRLRHDWRRASPETASGAPVDLAACTALLEEVLSTEQVAEFDRFEIVQLADVVTVCRRSRSASDAGRALFAASRARRSSTNDSDRVRKYLLRYGLSFDAVQA